MIRKEKESNIAVSVIMSTYNEELSQLREAVDSILNQTFSNYEYIIVNDNPNRAELCRVLREYKENDERIIILENDNNIGLSKSLNKAIKQAKGKYIMRMDADDISIKDRMELQYSYLERNHEVSMIFGDKEDIDIHSKRIFTERVSQLDNRRLNKMLMYGNPVIHPSVMIRKNVFDTLEGYRDIRGGEDYDLWLRMLTNNNVIRVIHDKPILLYRIRENSITRSDFFWAYFSGEYARKLYKERKRKGFDSYSYENMNSYMEKLRKNHKKCKAINIIYGEIGGDKIGKNRRIIQQILRCPSTIVFVKNLVIYKILEM